MEGRDGEVTWMEEKDYQRALRGIEEALRTGGEKLVFFNSRDLTQLPPEITKLTALTWLNLRDTRIQDVKALSGLTALTSLNLSGTRIQDVEALSELTALTWLDLGGTKIQDVEALSGLTALTSLDLGRTKIQDMKALSGLTALTSLNLSGTAIQDVKVLSGLAALTSLDLGGTKIQNVKTLSGLTALISLNLRNTKIQDVEALRRLTALTWLDLGGTAIQNVKALSGLTALTWLDLGRTKIQDVKALSGLTALTWLDLSQTRIQDVKALNGLTELFSLNLSGTKIQDAKALSGLTALTSLNLASVPIQDVKVLSGLTALTSLNLSGTKIQDVKVLSGLTALLLLGLQNCQSLPALRLPLEMLERLGLLYLHGCTLADVPQEYCQRGFLENVAREVYAYFRAKQEQGSSMLDECKLLFLGNGRAGKTSTRKALQGERFDAEEDSTHAIQLHRWDRDTALAGRAGLAPVRVNVWDFGGQDIYHQAHRLFLRTRAVFILCWNAWEDRAARREEWDEPRDVGYWIAQVRSASLDARILLVRTHADADAEELQRRGLAEVPGWREQAPGVEEDLPCIAVNNADGGSAAHEEIQRWLNEALAAELSRGCNEYSAAWVAVRRALEPLERANDAAFAAKQSPPHGVLGAEEFATLVRGHLPAETWERDLPFVRQFLHDVGALFYDARLEGRVVLDQRWAIEGIYAVLQRGPGLAWLLKRGGLVAGETLASIWSARGYNEGEQGVLLEFLQSCGQAVRIVERAENTSGDEVYLVPTLLPTREQMMGAGLIRREPIEALDQAWTSPKLGSDVAQAFIVAAAQEFRRGGLYWRWGAQISSQRLGAMARVEWLPHPEWLYGGVLSVKVWGDYEGHVELTRAIEQQLRPFLPDDARTLAGFMPEDEDPRFPGRPVFPDRIRPSKPPERRADATPAMAERPLQAVADSPAVAHGKRLTFSLAGADDEHPALEGAPDALYHALAADAKAQRWAVFSYKHSTAQPDLCGLLTYVGTADYVVVFLSEKYLCSRYCLEELRLVYEAQPRGFFPPENTRIFGLGEWKPGKETEWRSLSNGWMRELRKWRKDFAATIRDFVEDDEAVKKVRSKVPAIGWYGLCGKAGELAEFIATLRSYVAEKAPHPFIPGDPVSETWLAVWTAEIGERLGL